MQDNSVEELIVNFVLYKDPHDYKKVTYLFYTWDHMFPYINTLIPLACNLILPRTVEIRWILHEYFRSVCSLNQGSTGTGSSIETTLAFKSSTNNMNNVFVMKFEHGIKICNQNVGIRIGETC